MRLYHFKGGEQFEFDAHIFAANDHRACELFVIQLLLNGKSDDQMIWREPDIDEFDEPDRTQLCRALALGVEGIAVHEPKRGWCPMPPFDNRELPD
jgi:hypothetical protein